MELVLLPGMDGTGYTLQALQPHLGPELESRIIAYPRDRVLEYDELEAFVRERLPDKGPFWVLGESFSGPLAIRLAADPPCGMEGVILDVTFASCPLNPVHRLGYRVFRTTIFRHQIPKLILSWRLFDSEVPVEQLVAFKKEADEVAPEVMLARVRMMESIDVRPLLREVPMPIGYIQATKDLMVGPWALRQIQRVRPDVRVERVVGPHLLLMRQPRLAARAIKRIMGIEQQARPASA